jgi:hypothetical protein
MPDEPPVPPPGPGSLEAIALRYHAQVSPGVALHAAQAVVNPAGNPPAPPPPPPTVRESCEAWLASQPGRQGLGLQSLNGFAYQRKPPKPPPPIVTPPRYRSNKR